MIDMQDANAFLSYVTDKLKVRIGQLGESISLGQRDIDQMHEYYWENYTEMDEYGYENFDNQQALFGQMKANEESIKRRSRFRRMLSSPFFGRVIFQYEDEDEEEIFYIGIGNFSETEGSIPLIFDWRAPVSSLFYDYDKGPASYEAPGGTMEGEILSKCQYLIRGGKMIYGFESDVKIDDEVLKRELGSRGEDKLKNIIRTIQKEQNAIIRNTKDKLMAIQGVAGSGKTSIALHRIAFLLYHDRERLKSSNILILSPSGIFADYISQILPELGEENIREMTFDLFAYKSLKQESADCEDRMDFLEQQLSGRSTQEDVERCRFKQSKEYATLLEGFILELEDSLMRFTPVSYKGVNYTNNKLLDYFYQRFADVPLLSRMEMIADRFIDEVETLKDKNLSDEEKQQLLDRFQGMYTTRDVYQLYNRFLKSQGLRRLPDRGWEKRCIPYEDVYPMLYMKYRLFRIRPDARIRHLVVDEMQDYSWIQFRLLSQMFSCRMTILGDKAQTMGIQQENALTFLPDIFGKEIRCLSMNKCYRNTWEIATYANSLIDLTGVELVERHGRPVEMGNLSSFVSQLSLICSQMRESLEAFQPPEKTGEGLETVAIITLTKEDARDAYQYLLENLKDLPKEALEAVCHLHKDSKSFQKGLTVTTFYLAKGLEFDRVYMLFPDKTPAADALVAQARYIAATRAMHELFVMDYQRDL